MFGTTDIPSNINLGEFYYLFIYLRDWAQSEGVREEEEGERKF